MSDSEMPTEEELRGIFRVFQEELPDLLGKLTKILYGAQESEDYGKAVGAFYKTLVGSGMTSEQAFQLTRDYMSNMNIGNIVRGMSSDEDKRKGHKED
jgi:hypothetical protein